MSQRAHSPESTEISAFLSAVRAVPKLSREDEHALAVRFRDAADQSAGVRLIEANLRYVVAIAIGYRRYRVRLADLVSEGNLGLMTALAKFDPSRGTRFVTYAAHWIRAFILDHVIRASSLVAGGTGALRSKVFFRLRRERAKVAAETSDAEEAMELLAARFGTTPEKMAVLAQRLEARDVSLDVPAHEEGGASMVETMASPLPSQEEELGDCEQRDVARARIRAAMDRLDARERFIVEVRMMADDPEELSLAEIGRQLGVSRERARQLEVRAKAKLRRTLEEASGPSAGMAAPSPREEAA
jgi:RNA polymerase sigma-32 factor